MTKQADYCFAIAFAILLTYSTDATAGGFGLFKGCRPKAPTCCPPPPSQSCPSPVVETIVSETVVQVGEDPAIRTPCWKASGWGYGAGYHTETSACKSSEGGQPATTVAVDELEELFEEDGATLMSVYLIQCECEDEGDGQKGTENKQPSDAEVPDLPGTWVGYVRRGQSNNARFAEGSFRSVFAELNRVNNKNKITMLKIAD